jgi:predicted DNA-binding helix-hairpin-helix protein
MEAIDKLKVLSADSQYDMACACGTGNDDRRTRGMDGKWLYPVSLPQGGYSVLLKTLLSNACSKDCKYCPLRSETNVKRCTLNPEEVARVFMEYYSRKIVFGLFLSSAVIYTPDHTMDKINSVASLLRKRYGFKGYIHLKVIPGASDAAIAESISLASAVSLNIETPGKEHFDLLSDRKDYMKDIIHPLKLMSKLTGRGMRHSRVKCTTQFIVGASDEKDGEIIKYMTGLYDRLKFQRVYFSAYQQGLGNSDIPGEKRFLTVPEEPFMREHRLYQSDFLLRKYGFSGKEIPLGQDGNLRLDKDPKEVWAEMHPEFYPVRINRADREELLRVPGIGHVTVERILKSRSEVKIGSLNKLGLKGKRLEKVRGYVVCE